MNTTNFNEAAAEFAEEEYGIKEAEYGIKGSQKPPEYEETFCVNCDTEAVGLRNGQPYCYTCSRAFDAGGAAAEAAERRTP